MNRSRQAFSGQVGNSMNVAVAGSVLFLGLSVRKGLGKSLEERIKDDVTSGW